MQKQNLDQRRMFHFVYLCYMFSVRRFKTNQVCNGEDFGSMAPVLRTCARVASVGEWRHRRVDASVVAVVIVRWSNYLDIIFIMFGMLYTSAC